MGSSVICPDCGRSGGRNNADAGQYRHPGTPACQWCEKRGEKIGRSRGGLSIKVHAVTDGPGNPLHFLLSGGNRNDICMAQELLEPFDLTGKLILADRGYDSAKFIRWVEERGGIVVIPSRVNAKCPGNTDWHTCKERHLIEKWFLYKERHLIQCFS